MGKRVNTLPVAVKIEHAFWRNTHDKGALCKFTLYFKVNRVVCNTTKIHKINRASIKPNQTKNIYTLSNFEIRHDVTYGRLGTSLGVTIKRACFAVIPYTTHAFYCNFKYAMINDDIASNLEVGQVYIEG